MSIDLDKLTPAPWTPYRYMQVAATNEYALLTPDGQGYCKSKTDMEFAALARAAFDVMMRRPWGVDCVSWNEGGEKHHEFEVTDEVGHAISRLSWADPFTALVKADEWYKANIEKVVTP